MSRIYDSDALRRDDDPGSPRKRPEDRGNRSINWGTASHALLPNWLRHRAIAVDVKTPHERFAVDERVDFRVRFRNRMPFPVTLRTQSPVPWHWTVDGHVSAVRAPLDEPDEPSLFRFSRAETKTFTRYWTGQLKTGERIWTPVGPGEYDLGVAVNVVDPETKGLAATTTVRLERR